MRPKSTLWVLEETPMHDDLIRQHIAQVAKRDDASRQRLIARIAERCWPGGTGDRVEPVALHWLRHWRPAQSVAPLPVCTCASGRCGVCN
jgi:hypothetical protein